MLIWVCGDASGVCAAGEIAIDPAALAANGPAARRTKAKTETEPVHPWPSLRSPIAASLRHASLAAARFDCNRARVVLAGALGAERLCPITAAIDLERAHHPGDVGADAARPWSGPGVARAREDDRENREHGGPGQRERDDPFAPGERAQRRVHTPPLSLHRHRGEVSESSIARGRDRLSPDFLVVAGGFAAAAKPAGRSLDACTYPLAGLVANLRIAKPPGWRTAAHDRKGNHCPMHWLSPGDNAWQMTAATLVGLMSLPGLVVLYGGVMQKRWSVNSMMMAFIAFAIVLVVWVLYGFKMGFGAPIHIFGEDSPGSFFGNFLGKPGPVLDSSSLLNQGTIPELGDLGKLAFPQSSLIYFQFVFAAITPILMLGSVLGRINFKAWIPFVLIWISVVYVVNAFMIWGGGYFAQHGALDFSGGYVIPLAAGVSGFVAAAVIGPRLQRDREVDAPNNLAMVAVGAGLLWLGWNGFN